MLVRELDLIKFQVRLYIFSLERENREREKPCGKAKDLSQRNMAVSYASTYRLFFFIFCFLDLFRIFCFSPKIFFLVKFLKFCASAL